MIEELRGIGLIVLAVVAAWLVFRVVKKVILALLTVLILGAVALFVYVKFF
jgi:hypothetical protein